MKTRLTIAALLLFASALAASAKDVTLGWNSSPTTGVTNYNVYASRSPITTANAGSASIHVNAGNVLTATLPNLGVGTWYFAVDAEKGGLKSDVITISAEIPAAPVNLRIIP